jgi:phosphatidylglycerol:prolipoprotein diacylglycerol transferase
MQPILMRWGPVTIYTYGVLVATGVLLGLWYARRHAPRAGLDPDQVWNLGIYAVLSALIVAKLWLVALDASYYWAHPREIFAMSTLQSGGTFYGGLLGALALLLIYTHYAKMPLLPVMDTYAAALPLGHAVGRLGCFAAGCCYGKPTWLPWGVKFTSLRAQQLVGTPLNIPLHPTQLYESAAEVMNFIFLIWLARRQRFTGQLFAAYLMLYGVERGLIEFLRGDPDRTLMFNGAVSLMQIVSVFMVLFGALLWYRGTKQEPIPAHARR